MSHAPAAPAHPPSNPTPSGGGIHPAPAWIPSAIVIFCLILAIVAMAKGCASNQDSKASASYSVPQAPVVAGPQRTLYTFDNECVEVYLGGKWSSYPLGGKIKFIETTTGKTVLEDSPGITTNIALTPGWYRICAAEKKATGVEIWQ